MFSTFPVWYGAVFSGMYPLFVLILLALLLRGVSFEYRNQVDSERWRAFWDWMSFGGRDRKSTRLNSSHANISYAVFCLKKKTRPYLPHSPVAYQKHH